ncbi:Helitron helicase [Phytophthora megakarya]|uniref:Helitron helicase n=1 Tax=Phytophthora megakarya TaxID=4795 RepID=A0A225VLX6_9STRA|nr:Helitron helicase [Phytophthora megakarya]
MYELKHTVQDSVTGRDRQQNTSNGTIELDANDVGRRLILPPSFTGGPRYMYQRFMDAMAIVRELGAPNLFITYTCNPKKLTARSNSADLPDIVARGFMQKLKAINKNPDESVLGIQAARIHVVEYQKRGLPHAHILLISRPVDRPLTAEDVNRLVSAERPDKEKHPHAFETVVVCMLHGPCGDAYPNCPRMKNGKCDTMSVKTFRVGDV